MWGVKISKRYSSYSFHPTSAKLYEDIGYQSGTQTVAIRGNRPRFTNFVTLSNFNMGVNGKIFKNMQYLENG